MVNRKDLLKEIRNNLKKDDQLIRLIAITEKEGYQKIVNIVEVGTHNIKTKSGNYSADFNKAIAYTLKEAEKVEIHFIAYNNYGDFTRHTSILK